MKYTLWIIFLKLPTSLKALIMNIICFLEHTFVFKSETFFVEGEKINLYRNKMFSNSSFIDDLIGYNLYYKLKKGDVVVDAGAYDGDFTIYASKKVGSLGKIIAFEPDPYNLTLLKKNITLNECQNVYLVKKGLYNKNAILPFNIFGSSSSIINQKSLITINKIEVTTLDSELKQLKVKRVNFIKMDIEAAEIEAIKGCKQTIKNNPNINLAIASYHHKKGKKTCFALEKFFKTHGLNVITTYDKHLTTFAWKGKAKRYE